jgi:hypothetical protein
MQNSIKELSKKLNISIDDIEKIYKYYWEFIFTKIESLPLKEDLNEEAFNQLKTNFNIPYLGKLHCTYDKYRKVKEINRSRENAKYKENKVTR